MPVAPDFESALIDLQRNLPDWWASRQEESTLYKILAGSGESIDALAWAFEQPYLDQSLQTASEEGLLRNFALAWGVQNERLPPASQLRAYIEARTQEDGSLPSLLRTLTTLLETPPNTTGGTILRFPAEGGLTFPANGEGLPLYEFEPGGGPKAGLVFPADGSGLRFPTLPETVLSEETVTAATGQTPPGAGRGLVFSQNGYVEILPNTPGPYELEVVTLNWLDFDRKAFQRAVERFQPAHCVAARIREVAQVEL